MSEFVHSEILFSSDDGIPLEFNIQYAKDKATIKSLIEHGGGLCTLKHDVIHIVSPGTTVLNVSSGIKLVSTSFIYDCVKQNYLFDTDEYRFIITEMETSDISDNSQNLVGDSREQKIEDKLVNNAVDIIDCSIKTPSPNSLTCPNSNHDFDFQDSDNPDNLITNNEKNNLATSLQPVNISSKPETNMIEKEGNKTCIDTEGKSFPTSVNNEGRETQEAFRISENNQILNDNNQDSVHSNQEAVEPNDQDTSVDAEIVSSSQPENDVLDLFDSMILKKAQENPEKDDECLSQSCTVSSSADAQVSPEAPSNTSAEIFDGSSSAPDSASQTTERQQYINDLEKEIEQILLKPSPKSIQDKITFVKYICTVKKLAPAIVLQTLQNF